MPTVREAGAIAKKQLAQREMLWPGAETWIWQRKANKGFATIPKTMPMILQIMDNMSNGRPVSTTYLGLWCETWDNSMASLAKQQDLALAAGFGGQRAVYTWQGRVQLLKELRFIDTKAGKSGPLSNAIIWNPHHVIRWHFANKTPGLTEAMFNALMERASEIGANDMFDEIPAVVEPPPVPAPPPATPPEPAAAPAEGAVSKGVRLIRPIRLRPRPAPTGA